MDLCQSGKQDHETMLETETRQLSSTTLLVNILLLRYLLFTKVKVKVSSFRPFNMQFKFLLV